MTLPQEIECDVQFDPAHPVNHSPNNTGSIDLPPAEPAFIWYPYIVSDEFPELGSGSRSATGGPIYHRSDFKNPDSSVPCLIMKANGL